MTMATDTVSQPYAWTFRRVVGATLAFSLVVFCFWILYRFYHVLFILFIAIVIGTVIRPIVNWLYQRGIPRIAGVILVYILLLVLFAGFLRLLFPLIFEQSTTLATDIPSYYQDLRAWLNHNSNQLILRLGQLVPAALPSLSPRVTQQTGAEVVASAGQVLGYAILTARVIFSAILILALTFYWTLDGPRIIKTFTLLIPQDKRDSISELIL